MVLRTWYQAGLGCNTSDDISIDTQVRSIYQSNTGINSGAGVTQHPPMHQSNGTSCGFRWLNEALFLKTSPLPDCPLFLRALTNLFFFFSCFFFSFFLFCCCFFFFFSSLLFFSCGFSFFSSLFLFFSFFLLFFLLFLLAPLLLFFLLFFLLFLLVPFLLFLVLLPLFFLLLLFLSFYFF